jgi:hypothetical protein
VREIPGDTGKRPLQTHRPGLRCTPNRDRPRVTTPRRWTLDAAFVYLIFVPRQHSTEQADADGKETTIRLLVIHDSAEAAEAVVAPFATAVSRVRPLRPQTQAELVDMLGAQAVDLVIAAPSPAFRCRPSVRPSTPAARTSR